MDNMCNKLEVDDLNKTITNAEESVIIRASERCESPVFKCLNPAKPIRGVNTNSSDYDIPSYQINQSVKSRTSSKYDNETNDSVLPFSPVYSPIPVASSLQFQPPSVHTLGTVAKNLEKPCNNKIAAKGEKKLGGVLETLGINDKDISWVSSMASPPPTHVPGSEFNTVEKATFFPEEKFQNIQPRALFSPQLDDYVGCQPIAFSSDSEDDEAYKSNIRLSDVCATLNKLEVKSLEQGSDIGDNSLEKTVVSESQICLLSPVIKTKMKKSGGGKKKTNLLVKSPTNEDKYEFVVGERLSEKKKNERSSQSTNFIEDDSFQSISFSGIDELCKTLVNVTEQSDSSSLSKSVSNCDKTLMNNSAIYDSKPVPKQFYVNKISSDVCAVSSLDNLHSYALALEEGDLSIPGGNKIDKSFADKGIVRFDALDKGSSKMDATKRLHPELSEENDNCSEKKFKKVKDETLDWKIMKKYHSESQLNMSESEIFKTVENLEKTLASQESKDLDKEKQFDATETSVSQNEPKSCTIHSGNTGEIKDHRANNDAMRNYLHSEAAPGFTTASGSKISVSEKGLTKAREFLRECDEPSGSGAFAMGGFSTCSGKKIQISSEALEKAKKLMAECNEERPPGGFSTGSGKRIQVSAKALERGRALMAECDEMSATNWAKSFSTGSGKRIQVSVQALEKAKKLMSECEEKMEGTSSGKLATSWAQGASTRAGKKIQVSPEALEKAKALISTCDEHLKETSDELASIWMEELAEESSTKFSEKSESVSVRSCATASGKSFLEEKNSGEPIGGGFSTASGNEVKVSREALEKAKDFLSKADEVFQNLNPKGGVERDQSFSGFSTAAGCQVKISEAALAKAKDRTARWEESQRDDSDNLESVGNIEESKGSHSTKQETGLSTTSRVEESAGKETEGDWEEIIPGWLHVYSTSPSIASDRLGVSPMVSDEDGKASKPEREYIVKSPVLGSSDRFYRKARRRKLQFEETKPEEKIQGGGFVVPYKGEGRKASVKRSSNLSLDFSAPFKKTKLVVVGKEELTVADVKEGRRRARQEQDKTIKEKRQVKPLKGSLLSRKCSERQTKWAEAVGGDSPGVHSEEFLKRMGIKEVLLSVGIENAQKFKFAVEDFFGSNCQTTTEGIPAGDGCLLIPDDENRLGVQEVKRAFLASPGVQPNLVPPGWVENHYKWIIWKLSHYERSFPRHFGGRCLTPNNVTLQLKYRYDREIDRSERSALKKILERDETSIKRIVLCVCGIKKATIGDVSGYELSLTDGWYSCPARADPAMTRLIEKGKVAIGTKLMTQGAVLVNCEQGVSPLEINGNIYLKISTNSTRRVRWDTKLGFQKNPENFPISLNSILSQGGTISRLDVILVRIYPMLYMEKTSDGHHVTRNRRSEEKADAEYRRIQEERMEIIRNEIQSEMKKSAIYSEKKMSKASLSDIEQIEDLYQLMESSSDPSTLQENMSANQRRLQNFQLNRSDRFSRELAEKVENKLKKENLNKRNVSEFLRAKVVDCRKPDYNNPAVLSVWNPNEELVALLSEGKVISLTSVSLSNSSRGFKPLQINTTRQTQFREIIRSVKYPGRKLTLLKNVSAKVSPAFEEVDVVGLVALIRDVSYGSRVSQVVYLTDLERHFVGVVFWGSCKDYGWENVLRIRSLVACSNLQWNKNYSVQEVPSLHVNEYSTFTENPRHSHLKEEIERLKGMMPQDLNDFLSKCEEDLMGKLEESKWRANSSRNSSANESGSVGEGARLARPRVANGFESKPTASSTPIKPFAASAPSDEAEPSPIQRRIEKLQSYGEPPSLIPLLVRNNARRKFKKK